MVQRARFEPCFQLQQLHTAPKAIPNGSLIAPVLEKEVYSTHGRFDRKGKEAEPAK
jgi:hypothetical protein